MIGPVTQFALYMIGAWVEAMLISFIIMAVYSYLWQNRITRYTLAYPGKILFANVMVWIFLFCVWFVYTIFNIGYEVFASTGTDTPSEEYYATLANWCLFGSLCATAYVGRSIYFEEKGYWEDKTREGASK